MSGLLFPVQRGSSARELWTALRSARRTAYSSVHQDRRYDSGRTDGAAANYIKHKYKLHRTEIKGKRLWEIKASSREVMDQGRAMMGELRAMRGAGWNIGPMTYTSAISVFASYGLSKWAHRLLEEMIANDQEPTIETFNSLFWAYAENGELRGIHATWTQMKRLRVTPNEITFNVVLLALVKSGNSHVTLKMFELLKKEGMVASVQCYNTLISACSNAEEGWAVINRMKQDNVFPDQFSFYFLMKLAARDADVRAAEDILRQLAAHRVTASSAHWTILLSTYRVADDYEGACRVWERMKDAGVKPTSGTLTEIFRAQELEEIKKRRAKGETKEADLAESHLEGSSGACLRTLQDDGLDF
eukprot:TRINITY_DN66274_c0_g1_i1.p1 TRINITY_DN66274_c0_g1~~TRINITY_DN66274_c0_g1_i1.p1  ORF type:complete len:360 (+),score=95.06 TRINITY_DN66274_c0_g1_i1:256-1335(+)